MADFTIRDVDDHRLAYRRSGSGAPVLLMHGIATNSFIWREIIPSLETRSDVVAWVADNLMRFIDGESA